METKSKAIYPQAGETWRPNNWKDDSADITFEDSAPLCVFYGSGFYFTSQFVKLFRKVEEIPVVKDYLTTQSAQPPSKETKCLPQRKP